jgi:biopolymer transport protein ExbD
VRQAYATSAVISEIHSNGQNFATLQFVQSSPISPTMTEDGPYLGVFLTENQAVRSFQRDPTIGLTHNADFNRQVGDKRDGAAQVLFLDSPYLLDRAYRTAMPYLSLAGMFNKDLAALLKGRDLPADLTWLAPMGAWSCIITPDEDGVQGYSVSGVGNQGIFLAGAVGGTASVMQTMGLLPKLAMPPVSSPQPNPLAGAPSASQPGPTSSTPFSPPVPQPPALTDASTSSPADAPSNAVIYLTPEGKIFFNTTPVPQDQFGDFLKAKKAANQDLKLFVHMDKNASQDDLALVMDAGAQAGFGVLSYIYTSGADSHPPAATTNAASASVLENAPGTNSAPSAPVTNSIPDATPPTPSPAQTQ